MPKKSGIHEMGILSQCKKNPKISGGSRIPQIGAPTPKVGAPTHYLANFFLKTA